MSAAILHISGPPASGKTALARALARRRNSRMAPFLVRFDVPPPAGAPDLKIVPSYEEMSGCVRRTVNPQLVFEGVSETIRSIRLEFPSAPIIIETDAHPCFRHAYPYDVKVFVMKPPPSIDQVFRTKAEAALAIDKAMHDTSEFAAEIYGLDRDFQDSGVLPALDSREKRTQVSYQSVEEFLDSDVGAEIALRLQLHPPFHAIVDSDVILLNHAPGRNSANTGLCEQRLVELLRPLWRRLERRNWFTTCDPADTEHPQTRRGLERIESLLQTAEKQDS